MEPVDALLLGGELSRGGGEVGVDLGQLVLCRLGLFVEALGLLRELLALRGDADGLGPHVADRVGVGDGIEAG